MTTAEAASILGCTEMGVLHMVHTGRLPNSRKKKGRWVHVEKEVLHLVQSPTSVGRPRSTKPKAIATRWMADFNHVVEGLEFDLAKLKEDPTKDDILNREAEGLLDNLRLATNACTKYFNEKVYWGKES